MAEEKKNILAETRRTFITGLFLLIPIFVTYYIISIIFNIMDNALPFIGGLFPGLGFIVTLIVIFVIGFLAKNLFGKKLFLYFENIIENIPFIKNIYVSSKQIVSAITVSAGANSFKKVALVEYPRVGMYTIGFITKEKSLGITVAGEELAKDMISIFLPTSPNPTSGYFVMVPAKDVKILDMNVEEGFKMIMSAGIVNPQTKKK